MQFIFPTYPYSKEIDNEFKEEYLFCINNSIPYALIDFESMKIFLYNSFNKDVISIYRGWMLSNNDYILLSNKFKLDTNFNYYKFFQNINEWYPKLKQFTFKSYMFNHLDDVDELIFDSKPFVVKNFTKSLGIVSSYNELINLIKNQKQNNFDGIVLREYENLDKNELRFFVFRNNLISLNYDINHIESSLKSFIYDIINTINCDTLYTIDVVKNENNQWRLIEIGDGQVCSTKENSIKDLMYAISKI